MNPIKLMLADDNLTLRDTLSAYFAIQEDITLTKPASNGCEALELAESEQPDILLLDIIMPRLDGMGVLRELMQRPVRPKVIMLTALRSDEVIARAMELGASYYIVKPAEPQDIYEQIRAVAGTASPVRIAIPETPASAYAHWSPDERVANLFLSIGIPAHIKGYQYLREAVRMVIDDRDVINRITKELYPGIARRYGTSSSKVERAMRHAIEVAWNRGRLDTTNQLLGVNLFNERDKPTNGEFISLIAEKAAGE
ncbi:MAG: sporulation transcription factor Spo0A [Clostridia bacterium]|nr:sporulation transcription factor Spo0A [Clostridia bacterium]